VSLLKVTSKRRRTKAEIEEAKIEEAEKEAALAQKMQQLEDMKQQNEALLAQVQSNSAAANILSSWVEKGFAVMGDDGNCHPIGQSQRQSLDPGDR